MAMSQAGTVILRMVWGSQNSENFWGSGRENEYLERCEEKPKFIEGTGT